MALVSWAYNERRCQWECPDPESGTIVASITKEALDMMPPGALRDFWASAIFMRKVDDEANSASAEPKRTRTRRRVRHERYPILSPCHRACFYFSLAFAWVYRHHD